MVCAGNTDDNHRDVCKGDSGGPLACVQNNTMILTGITSYGYGCSAGNYPSFFTRISYYLPWIYAFEVSLIKVGFILQKGELIVFFT